MAFGWSERFPSISLFSSIRMKRVRRTEQRTLKSRPMVYRKPFHIAQANHEIASSRNFLSAIPTAQIAPTAIIFAWSAKMRGISFCMPFNSSLRDPIFWTGCHKESSAFFAPSRGISFVWLGNAVILDSRSENMGKRNVTKKIEMMANPAFHVMRRRRFFGRHGADGNAPTYDSHSGKIAPHSCGYSALLTREIRDWYECMRFSYGNRTEFCT